MEGRTKGTRVLLPPTNSSGDSQQELVALMTEKIKISHPRNHLNDVVGLEEVKQEILKQFLIILHPSIPDVLVNNKIVLFGASGSGKSSIVHGFANFYKANLVVLSPSLITMWARNMSTFMKLCLEEVIPPRRRSQLTMFFLPRVDESRYRSQQESWLVNQFVRDISSVWAEYTKKAKMLVIATMGLPQGGSERDVELLASFQSRVYVRPLYFPERKQLIEKVVENSGYNLALKEVEMAQLARSLQYVVVKEIVNVIKKAVHMQFRTEDFLRENNGSVWKQRPVTKADFNATLRQGFITFSKKYIEAFEQCNAAFGNGPVVNFFLKNAFDPDPNNTNGNGDEAAEREPRKRMKINRSHGMELPLREEAQIENEHFEQ